MGKRKGEVETSPLGELQRIGLLVKHELFGVEKSPKDILVCQLFVHGMLCQMGQS